MYASGNMYERGKIEKVDEILLLETFVILLFELFYLIPRSSVHSLPLYTMYEGKVMLLP